MNLSIPSCSCGGDGGDQSNNFEFAFNSSNFSDRVLRIEIVAGSPESRSDGEECPSIADWTRHRKRRREDSKKEKAAEIDVYNSDDIVIRCHPDTEDVEAYDNHDGESVAMIKSPTGDEPLQRDSCSMERSPVLKVKSIFISSAILAAESLFFFKLFSNGMRESDQKHATIRIHASEEAALMDLISFMYSGKLSNLSAPHVLDVLMVADKFEAAACMKHCSQLLRSQSMTTETALLYLELPSSISTASTIQPLTDAARDFLINKYQHIAKFQNELMDLPLAGVEAILGSNKLWIASEDAVYDFILEWARAQYPKIEERREILKLHIGRLVRLPYLTCRKLRNVVACNDLDREVSSKLVLEALLFKADEPHRQRAIASAELADRRYVGRSYKERPVKVVEFELPYPQCVVYLDLSREECAKLLLAGCVYFKTFHFGSQRCYLSACCKTDHPSSFFGLLLGILETGSVSFRVDFEVAAREKPTGDFVSKDKGFYLTCVKALGHKILFTVPWPSLMAEDSLYFINGILHLRVELTIKQSMQQQQQS